MLAVSHASGELITSDGADVLAMKTDLEAGWSFEVARNDKGLLCLTVAQAGEGFEASIYFDLDRADFEVKAGLVGLELRNARAYASFSWFRDKERAEVTFGGFYGSTRKTLPVSVVGEIHDAVADLINEA